MAQRIGRRTTDLIAISILAIGALMVGGRLSEWWSTDPEDTASPAKIASQEGGTPGIWGTPDSPVTLEFGSTSRSIRRQELSGPRDKVFGLLADWCRRTLRQSDVPDGPADEAERRLLTLLGAREAVQLSPGERIYRTDPPLAMIVGVRDVPGEKGNRENPEDASSRSRVVCWGFAFPVEEEVWTVFLVSPGGGGVGTAIPDVALPKGSAKHLSLRNDAGDGFVSFSGSGDPNDWRRGFDEWFDAHGWSPVRPWAQTAGAWSARFASPTPGEGERGWEGTADVQITPGDQGVLSGLLNLMPR